VPWLGLGADAPCNAVARTPPLPLAGVNCNSIPGLHDAYGVIVGYAPQGYGKGLSPLFVSKHRQIDWRVRVPLGRDGRRPSLQPLNGVEQRHGGARGGRGGFGKKRLRGKRRGIHDRSYNCSKKHSGLPTALHRAVLPPLKENTAVFQPLSKTQQAAVLPPLPFYYFPIRHSGPPTARILIETAVFPPLFIPLLLSVLQPPVIKHSGLPTARFLIDDYI